MGEVKMRRRRNYQFWKIMSSLSLHLPDLQVAQVIIPPICRVCSQWIKRGVMGGVLLRLPPPLPLLLLPLPVHPLLLPMSPLPPPTLQYQHVDHEDKQQFNAWNESPPQLPLEGWAVITTTTVPTNPRNNPPPKNPPPPKRHHLQK
jgi:hypothetical protein